MTTLYDIALYAADTDELTRLQPLASQLSLPLLQSPQATLLLGLRQGRLALYQADNPAATLQINFSTGKSAHRRQFGGGRGQPLARAIGLKQGATPTVIDATAGLGGDAFVLASLGCQVTLIERSPIVATLLQEALEAGQEAPEIAEICQRMALQQVDSIRYLQQLAESERPEMIYLDPMYPQRQKKAAVKKEMQLLQLLLGKSDDGEALLRAALQCATKRVVVKRPKGAEPLGGIKAHSSVESPNTRYDLYPIHATP